MKPINLIMLLLILPTARADFGFVPKQTINNIWYDTTFGNYTQTTIFLENKVDTPILIDITSTPNVITESQIMMEPLQRMNIPVTILVTQEKQTESITIKDEDTNFGGVTEITVYAKPNGTVAPKIITNESQIRDIEAFTDADQYKCIQDNISLNCTSPLKNVTIPIQYTSTKTKQKFNPYWIAFTLLACILIAIMIWITYTNRNPPQPQIQIPTT